MYTFLLSLLLSNQLLGPTSQGLMTYQWKKHTVENCHSGAQEEALSGGAHGRESTGQPGPLPSRC
jgi:hypothetical protein